MWKPAGESVGMQLFRETMRSESPWLEISLHPSEVIDHEWLLVIQDGPTRTELPVSESDFDDPCERSELIDVIQEAIRCQRSR